MIDLHTLIIVILMLSFANIGLGYSLPFDPSSVIKLAADIAVFASYLYLLRTLVRLPIAAVITMRRTWYARKHYKLNTIESLRDGYVRGFLDTRRWTVEPLALVDRLAVCGGTLLAATPGLGAFILTLGGIIGIALLIILYLTRGTFGWLLADKLDNPLQPFLNLPFIKSRD